MRLAGSVALLLALALGVTAKPSLDVLAAPDYLKFKPAGPLAAEHVSSVIAGAMGLETATKDVKWDGLTVGSAFHHPRASALITVLGHEDDLPSIKKASYELTQAADQSSHMLRAITHGAARSGQQTVASVLSKTFGAKGQTVSISSDAQAALLGGVAGTFGSHDHIVSKAQSGFEDSRKTFSLTNQQIAAAISEGIFGQEVYMGQSQQLMVKLSAEQEGALPLTAGPVLDLVSELACMIHMVKSLARPATAPFYASMIVSSWSAAAAAVQGNALNLQALELLLRVTLEAVTAQLSQAYPNNVAIYAATLPAHQATELPAVAGAATAHHERRSADAAAAAAGSSSISFAAPNAPNSESCQTFRCFCNADSNGKPFNPSTGCADTDACKDLTNPDCECAYHPCSCTSASVMTQFNLCIQCKQGFSLQNGICYVDSNYPVMVNIWLWIGIVLVLALIATCYVVAEMDPGRNSVIYRMTSQKPKSS